MGPTSNGRKGERRRKKGKEKQVKGEERRGGRAEGAGGCIQVLRENRRPCTCLYLTMQISRPHLPNCRK